MFDKVLIINRGEIALRIIHACRKLGVSTVAVYSEADADSPHLQFADESVCIGAGPSSKSYLNQDAILKAAEDYQCQAIHPGYGFLSENAMFATRCALQKVTFYRTYPSSLRLMGDKASARITMAKKGVLGVPGSKGIVFTVDEALEKMQKRLVIPFCQSNCWWWWERYAYLSVCGRFTKSIRASEHGSSFCFW